MLHLITSPRPLLSPSDAISMHSASRPGITRRNTRSKSRSSRVASDHDSLDGQSTSIRNSSFRNSTTGAAYDGFEIPHLTPTVWELERHRRGSNRRSLLPKPQLSTDVFKLLPREVYDCVLVQLKQLHFGEYQACPLCYIKDLFNLSLTSRSWDRAATLAMYQSIWVVGNEGHARTPKLRIAGTSRLKLLRRTLRERTALAGLVRELHMPDFQAMYKNATIEREEITNLVASLVIACPGLERLVGFHIPYLYSFDRLSHALSTRLHLRERVWFLAIGEPNDYEDEEDPTRGYYHETRDPNECFLELNSNHTRLTTLALHHDTHTPVANGLTFRAIIGTLRQLTSLRQLSLSGFPSSSFSNLALNALPTNLSSLRLENLPGINDVGLQRFASCRAAITLESVLLIDLELTDLQTVSLFLSPYLLHLKKFSLAQHKAPELFPGADFPEFFAPALEYIHWEIRSQAGPAPTLLSPYGSIGNTLLSISDSDPVACLATLLLASDISNGLFPSLCRIRAPHDPQGVLQALCKPLATALLPPDASFFTTLSRTAHISSTLRSDPGRNDTCSLKEFLSTAPSGTRTDSAISSPVTPTEDEIEQLHSPLGTVLAPTQSRLAAQSRIIAARKEPFMSVNIHDAKGALRLSKTINGFLGDVGSKITYDVRPDRNLAVDTNEEEGTNGWITDIGDVMGAWDVAGGASFGTCRHRSTGSIDRNMVNVQDMF